MRIELVRCYNQLILIYFYILVKYFLRFFVNYFINPFTSNFVLLLFMRRYRFVVSPFLRCIIE
jgi:hypothetical protein